MSGIIGGVRAKSGVIGLQAQGSTPCFYAQKSSTGSASTLVNTYEIPFDWVHFNVGGHYDGSSRFTAPYDGYYLFSMQYLTDNNGGRAVSYLAIDESVDYNGGQVIEMSHDTEEYNDANITAVVNLTAGQRVACNVGSNTNARVYSGAQGQNFFSGYMIGGM
jgi:hypothetical protein